MKCRLAIATCLLSAGAAAAEPLAQRLEHGDYAAVADAATARLQTAPDDLAARILLGRAQLSLGHTEDAVTTLKEAVKRAPQSADAEYWLGEALSVRIDEVGTFKKVGMASDIRNAFTRAVELAPDVPQYRMDLFEFYRQAPAVVGGNGEQARAQIAELDALDPAAAHTARAELLLDAHKTDEAEKEYRAAVAAAPENAEHRFDLGVLYENAQRWDEAWTAFEQLLKHAPHYTPAFYQLGKIAAESGAHLKTGASALKQYLAHPPLFQQASPAHAHLRLGQIYEKLQQRDDAQAEYQAALKLEPSLADAKKALDALGG